MDIRAEIQTHCQVSSRGAERVGGNGKIGDEYKKKKKSHWNEQ